jgi:Uma2 family endonuclease
VFRQPGADGYREVRRLRRGDVIAPQAFPEVVFAVADLLGPEAQPLATPASSGEN